MYRCESGMGRGCCADVVDGICVPVDCGAAMDVSADIPGINLTDVGVVLVVVA